MAKTTKVSKLAKVGEDAKAAAQKRLLLEALRESDGDVAGAAKALGIQRNNLYEVAARLGVDLSRRGS